MSLTDVAKSLHRRAVDFFCGSPILFIHVPKCGGTSIGRALRRAYILSQGTVKPHESAKAFEAAQLHNPRLNDVFELREMMLLYLLYCDTRGIAAHVPFSETAFERFGAKYAFVTMLRNPEERFLSHYRWGNRPQRQAASPEPLEDFLATERARWIGSEYVRFFSGDPGAERATSKHVEAAVNNLRRLHFVGFLDDLGSFESALRKLSGCRINIGRENVGRRSPDFPAAISPQLRKEIALVCSPDREIWEAVQDLRKTKPRQPSGVCSSSELGPASSRVEPSEREAMSLEEESFQFAHGTGEFGGRRRKI